MTRSKPRKHSEVAGALVARAATVTDSIADAGHSSDALAVVPAVVQAQTQQIASLVDLVHLLAGWWRVVSASFLNAKPAVGGIGVEPRRCGVLRVLFTVASDAVADTVVRSRRNLRDLDPSAAVFDVLSDREEAQHRAPWPAFLAAKAAGKRAQYTLFMEWLPTANRGRWLVVFQLWWTVGTLLEVALASALLNGPGGWRALTLASAAPFAALLALYPLVPDSPKLMMAQGRHGAAAALLQA
ncbi:hypothetical protein FOA52_007175 [Chlamydomonas sp. UWO 241]|nr:hypothetical protein FOA52_007175 [Chlamydomonas sp. UWO 241]